MFQNLINEWINTVNKKILLFHGKSGSGKFTYIKDTFSKKYIVNSFSYVDFLTGDINNRILNSLKNNKVLMMMNGNKKPMIVITETEFIGNSTLKSLFKILGANKKHFTSEIPIILIYSDDIGKFRKDFDMDFCLVEHNTNVNHYSKNIINKLNIKEEKMVEYVNNTIGQNNNLQLYDNINKLLMNYTNGQDSVNVFNLEKILTPLLIQENYKMFINKNKKYYTSSEDCICEMSNLMTDVNILNNFMVNKHCWSINNLISVLSCNYSSYLTTQKYKNKKSKHQLAPINIKYTKVLINNSTLFLNFKYYKTVLQSINYIHDFDSSLLDAIINDVLILILFKDKRAKELIKKYGIEKYILTKGMKMTNNSLFMDNFNTMKKLINNIYK